MEIITLILKDNLMASYQINDHDLIAKTGKDYVLRVKDLPELDKPREKLIAQGPAKLSAAELLAIVLNVGNKKEDVLTLSARLLKDYGEKAIISQTNPTKLSTDLKVPIVKSCQIVACFELGRRFFQKRTSGSVTIRNAHQAFEYLKDMRQLTKEHFRGLYLNSRYQLIRDEVISIGSLTSSLVHPREVFKPAIEYSAVAIIIAHNHPSGSLKATAADIETTKQLIKAGEILGIDVLDHLIIAQNKFISLNV
jgi:DNA repair protein RadC